MWMDTSLERPMSPGTTGAGIRSAPQPHFASEEKTERRLLSAPAAAAVIAGMSLGLWWLLWMAVKTLVGLF
jgi:hypothetical protein